LPLSASATLSVSSCNRKGVRMDGRPFFLMTDPACFDVSYRINP
jgi:hypothetical protein